MFWWLIGAVLFAMVMASLIDYVCLVRRARKGID
jgi:hypothetical protein